MSTPIIAAVVGTSNISKQDLLAEFVQRRRRQGLRVAGIIEIAARTASGACGSLSVVDLATGERIAARMENATGNSRAQRDAELPSASIMGRLDSMRAAQ